MRPAGIFPILELLKTRAVCHVTSLLTVKLYAKL